MVLLKVITILILTFSSQLSQAGLNKLFSITSNTEYLTNKQYAVIYVQSNDQDGKNEALVVNYYNKQDPAKKVIYSASFKIKDLYSNAGIVILKHLSPDIDLLRISNISFKDGVGGKVKLTYLSNIALFDFKNIELNIEGIGNNHYDVFLSNNKKLNNLYATPKTIFGKQVGLTLSFQ